MVSYGVVGTDSLPARERTREGRRALSVRFRPDQPSPSYGLARKAVGPYLPSNN